MFKTAETQRAQNLQRFFLRVLGGSAVKIIGIMYLLHATAGNMPLETGSTSGESKKRMYLPYLAVSSSVGSFGALHNEATIEVVRMSAITPNETPTGIL